MSRNLERSRLRYESVINDRNQRPLTIALATILIVWMVAFGLVFVLTQIGADSGLLADGPVPVTTIE
jgi:hypothetical protein